MATSRQALCRSQPRVLTANIGAGRANEGGSLSARDCSARDRSLDVSRLDGWRTDIGPDHPGEQLRPLYKSLIGR